MKRLGPAVYPAKLVEDIKQDLTPEQLAGIGAASLAFNAAEKLFDRAIAIILGLSAHLDEFVLAKIGSVDEKAELLKLFISDFATQLSLDQNSIDTIQNTINVFLDLKILRNASVHVTHIDTVSNTGIVKSRTGKTSRVLLTTQALDGLYNRLVCVHSELDFLCVALCIGISKMVTSRSGIDPFRMAAEPTYQEWLMKLKVAQDHRKALPPMPEVP